MERIPCENIVLHLLILLASLAFHLVSCAKITTSLSRHEFPPGFVFGAGSSAYQIEGAAAEDGRTPSVWDTYAHEGKNMDNSTADVTADQYHKYKEDVKLMHDMGLDAYRFSISWSRLIPGGRGPINQKGLEYYNNLINELLKYGIDAHVTLNHFDLPQALEDEYEGTLSPRIIEDFNAYADVCFREFGDRVKYWITFNEPNIETVFGCDLGQFPPARCSLRSLCAKGNSSTEPYISAHNILLSHAAAVQLYREKYQAAQKGQIGLTILAFWIENQTDSARDIAAAQRARDFHLGWFLDPLMYGDYPAVMRKNVGSRLPSFRPDESEQLKGSFDFIGLNHYTVMYMKDVTGSSDTYGSAYLADISATVAFPGLSRLFRENQLGIKGTLMPAAPWALQRLLEYVKLNYQNIAVMIHENGYGEFNLNSTNDADEGIDDAERTDYLEAYIKSMLPSIRDGSNIKGYFVWSMLDSFELVFGYTNHYGLYHIDFSGQDRQRQPKQSAHWYTNFLKNSGRGGSRNSDSI